MLVGSFFGPYFRITIERGLSIISDAKLFNAHVASKLFAGDVQIIAEPYGTTDWVVDRFESIVASAQTIKALADCGIGGTRPMLLMCADNVLFQGLLVALNSAFFETNNNLGEG